MDSSHEAKLFVEENLRWEGKASAGTSVGRVATVLVTVKSCATALLKHRERQAK